MILRSQVAAKNTHSGPTRSHKRSTSRQVNRHQHSRSNQSDVLNHEEDTYMEDQTMLDMHAADKCVDQPHIYSDPAWKAFDLCPSSECSTGSASEDVLDELESEGNLQSAGALGSCEYKEQHSIVFFKLCPKERRWLDFGPGIAIMEGGMYASTVTVRMERTFRVLATWSIFGGMKVIRFLSTVIVLAIVPDDEGTQRVVSYGLKLATLEEAKGLAILLSSTTRGLQMNMERLVPRTSAAKRAKILEIMADRLKALKRRLDEKEESELSAKVESELAAMLSVGIELTE